MQEPRGSSAAGDRAPHGGAPTIAVAVPSLDSEHTVALVRGVEEELRARGCKCVISCSHNDPWWERRQVRLDRQRGVAGLVVYPAHGSQNAPLFREVVAARLPLVYVDRHHGGVTADRVATDNVAGAAAGVELLLRRGHRRIAFVNGHEREVSAIDERLQGYCEAHERHGLVPDFRLVLMDVLAGDVLDDEARQRIAGLRAGGAPTAALVVNASAAAAFGRHLDALGLPCELVAFTGGGPPSCGRLAASLRMPAEAMGREAAAIVARRIAGDWEDWPLHRVVPVELQAASPDAAGEAPWTLEQGAGTES